MSITKIPDTQTVVTSKTLILDIEVLPATVLAYDLRTTYINKSMIVTPRRTCLICSKWADDPEVFIFAEWLPGGHKKMLDDIWKQMDEANVIITFNGDGYDLKELATEFVQAGMTMPSGYQSIDLYKVAKRRFRFMSSSLQFIAEALNTGHQKLDSGGIELVKKIMADDESARAEYMTYCSGDVLATEELFHRLFTYLPKAPNKALIDGVAGDCCPACLSEDYRSRGYYYLATGKYRRFKCNECFRYFRARSRCAAAEYREVA